MRMRQLDLARQPSTGHLNNFLYGVHPSCKTTSSIHHSGAQLGWQPPQAFLTVNAKADSICHRHTTSGVSEILLEALAEQMTSLTGVLCAWLCSCATSLACALRTISWRGNLQRAQF